jgi:hypothetical protein
MTRIGLLTATIAICACTPAERQSGAKSLTDVLGDGDLVCAVVGYDDGTEAKLCRAAVEVGRLIAELATATPVTASAQSSAAAKPEALERPVMGAAALAPPRKVISVRLVVERPPPSTPPASP